MRVLHTADWHVGKGIARHSRLDESRAVLAEIADVATERAVDLVVVSGDVFEHHSPSAESEHLVFEALLRLGEAGIKTVVIAGNHDSPKRWSALKPLLALGKVLVVPTILKPDSGGVLRIPSRSGDETIEIAALPWVPERFLVSADTFMGLSEEPYVSYAEGIKKLYRLICAGLDHSNCTMLAGHVYVDGSPLGGGERSLTVGQVYAMQPQGIPNVQYAALGHVHRPQRVAGSSVPARYAGSVLQMDFGEESQEKSVVLVELTPGRPASTELVALTAGRELTTLSGTLDDLRGRTQSVGNDWLRIVVDCEVPVPGVGEEVRELFPNAVEVRLNYTAEADAQEIGQLRDLSLQQQFAKYYQRRHGSPPSGEILALLEEAVSEVTE